MEGKEYLSYAELLDKTKRIVTQNQKLGFSEEEIGKVKGELLKTFIKVDIGGRYEKIATDLQSHFDHPLILPIDLEDSIRSGLGEDYAGLFKQDHDHVKNLDIIERTLANRMDEYKALQESDESWKRMSPEKIFEELVEKRPNIVKELEEAISKQRDYALANLKGFLKNDIFIGNDPMDLVKELFIMKIENVRCQGERMRLAGELTGSIEVFINSVKGEQTGKGGFIQGIMRNFGAFRQIFS